MNEKSLRDQLVVISDGFKKLQEQGDQKRKELENIEDELKRFQGEYRAIEKLIESMQADPAKTVTVKEKQTNGK